MHKGILIYSTGTECKSLSIFGNDIHVRCLNVNFIFVLFLSVFLHSRLIKYFAKIFLNVKNREKNKSICKPTLLKNNEIILEC